MSKNEKKYSLKDHFCFSIYSTNNLINRLYVPILDKLGLTYPQYLVLVALGEKNKLLVGELCETLFLKSNTITPLLKRMEGKTLVRRSRSSEDERQVIVTLTREGEELLKQASNLPQALINALDANESLIAELNSTIQAAQDQILSSNH